MKHHQAQHVERATSHAAMRAGAGSAAVVVASNLDWVAMPSVSFTTKRIHPRWASGGLPVEGIP
jgi:hypothetical protein